MSNNTKIEWTEVTWNPLRGCSRVSEGCRNCYAEGVAGRFSGPGQPYEGLITKTAKGPTWNGKIMIIPEKLEEPLRWKRPRMIFVNSMSDLFHENVPESFIRAVFVTMANASQHTFQVLTKRPERMNRLLNEWQQDGLTLREGCGVVLPNVWIGVSVENQEAANERIPLLLDTPAAVRWISAEPLLGPVDISEWIDPDYFTGCADDGIQGLHWVVAGGESGPNARPMHPKWAQDLRNQCKAAGVAYFFKQWGEWKPISQGGDDWYSNLYKPNRIAVDHENQDNLNDIYGKTCTVKNGVVHFDGSLHGIELGAFEAGAMHTFKVGKKASGRTLDGRTWDEYPK